MAELLNTENANVGPSVPLAAPHEEAPVAEAGAASYPAVSPSPPAAAAADEAGDAAGAAAAAIATDDAGGACAQAEPLPDEILVPVAPLVEELTEEQRTARIAEATLAKNEGNKFFAKAEYEPSVEAYSQAISLAPFHEDAAVFYGNRAACYAKLSEHQKCIDDCTKALDLKPGYTKVLLRRAQARESIESLDAALEDFQKVLEQDPRNVFALDACKRLPPRIEEQREKLKTEMLDKLKDLGNMILRPFGLSTNSFNMVKDPATGSYSMQFNNK